MSARVAFAALISLCLAGSSALAKGPEWKSVSLSRVDKLVKRVYTVEVTEAGVVTFGTDELDARGGQKTISRREGKATRDELDALRASIAAAQLETIPDAIPAAPRSKEAFVLALMFDAGHGAKIKGFEDALGPHARKLEPVLRALKKIRTRALEEESSQRAVSERR